MIKRIIFDLDNTLIKWENKYDQSIVKAYKKFNIDISNEELNEFNKVLRNYENKNDEFNIELMTEFYNKYYKIGMPNNFIEEWMNELGLCIPTNNEELNNALKYLSEKYELVILTNWYTKSQKSRLKNLDILKYFKEIIGADIVKMKPNVDSFIYAKGEYNYNECLVIGDDIKIDLEVPRKLGMRTILYTCEDHNYDKMIRDIEKIEEM